MSLIFFLRPAKTSEDVAEVVVGGHFLPEEAKKHVAESPLFVFSLKKEAKEPLKEELPSKQDLEAPPDLQAKLSKLDEDTKDFLFNQARLATLQKQLELLDLEQKLAVLTQELRKAILEFEDEFLLTLLID